MAEGGDSGEFKGTIAGQAIGFSTTNLTQTLLIILLGVLGWLIWTQLDKRLETAGRLISEQQQAIHAQHVKFYELLTQNRESTRDETERILKNLSVLNWNCVHDVEHQIPFGINGDVPRLEKKDQ